MLHANRTGIAVGVIIASWHLLWSVLVVTGVAQAVLDFIFWIHFIAPAYTVEGFAADRAFLLVAITFVIWYTAGGGFAILWNRLHR